MKALLVGDPHATADDLQDVGRLADLVLETAIAENVSVVVFLGDMHHNFALTNVKVTSFWRETFKALKSRSLATVALVGNHDMPGDGSGYPHALLSYEDLAVVVDKPWSLLHVGFLPYMANPNLFLEAVQGLTDQGARFIICHQEFNGAEYDNGYYAPNGVDPQAMPVPVISGHIHTPQILGVGGSPVSWKVWYPGAPRWRTLSDASVEERFLEVVDLKATGELEVKGVPTSPHLKKIWRLTSTPEADTGMVDGIKLFDEVRLHIEGPASYIKDTQARWRDFPAKVRISTTVTGERTVRVRESDGIEVAFKKYVEAFQSKYGTAVSHLKELARLRLWH